MIGNLTPRQQQLLMLADHAEAYVQQEARENRQHDRPDNFGSVSEARQKAFQ